MIFGPLGQVTKFLGEIKRHFLVTVAADLLFPVKAVVLGLVVFVAAEKSQIAETMEMEGLLLPPACLL